MHCFCSSRRLHSATVITYLAVALHTAVPQSGHADESSECRTRLTALGARIVAASPSGAQRVDIWHVPNMAGVAPIEWKGASSDLQLLARIGEVRDLSIQGVNDIGNLDFLPDITGIDSLSIDVTGKHSYSEVLQSIGKTRSLQKLRISFSSADATQSFRGLAGCTQLRHLVVTHLAATDQDIRPLSAMKLVSVRLQSSRVTERSLETMAAIESLERLAIPIVLIDLEGVRLLKSATKLQELRCSTGRITNEAKAWIHVNLPNCEVVEETSEPDDSGEDKGGSSGK